MKQPSKPQAFSACTLTELCPEDKQKVAKLVKQVVELGQENQRLKEAVNKASAAAEDKLKQIQECNKEAVKENCSLKSKLGQAVTVLRMYHHKVQGLDATIRALQNAASTTDVKTGVQQVQLTQDQRDASIRSDDSTASTQSARAGSKIHSQQQPVHTHQHIQVPLCAMADEQSHRSATSPATSAAAAAALLQQQAEQLSRLIAEHKLGADTSPHPAAAFTTASETTGKAFSTPASSCGLTAAKQAEPHEQHISPQAAYQAPARAVASQDNQLLPIAPLVLPSYCNVAAREALHDLTQWQLQQGLAAPEQLVDTTRKVLQYDPAIGSHGAFIIKDLPEIAASAIRSQEALPGNSSILHSRDSSDFSSSQRRVQRADPQQHVLPAADQPLPRLRLPASCMTLKAGSNSCNAAATAVDGAVSSTLQPGPTGLPGLCAASPWYDPTNTQLLNLAEAFNSLAGLSPASAAARGRLTPAAGSQCPIAAATSSSSTCRDLSCNSRSTASTVCDIAPVGAMPVGSMSSLSVDAGEAAKQSVQEVPVECVDGWQVPVVVQNEKSLGSCGGHSSQLTSPVQHQQLNGVHATLPAYPVLPEGQQQRVRMHEQCMGLQEPLASCVPDPGQVQQQPPEQQRLHLAAYPQQQQQYAYTTQQQLSEMQLLQLADSQQQAQAPVSTGPQVPGEHDHNVLSVQHHLHPSHPAQQRSQRYHHNSEVVWAPAGSAEEQDRDHGAGVGAADRHVVHADQQHGHLVASYADLAASADTQDLLERFDESLVDLLMEVERLEQQHQMCNCELLSDTPRVQRKLPLQQIHQQSLAVPDTQQAMDTRLDAAEGKYQCMRHVQHPQLQQHRQIQHIYLGTQLHSVSAKKMPVTYWQHQKVDEDDVVSDILNHLD